MPILHLFNYSVIFRNVKAGATGMACLRTRPSLRSARVSSAGRRVSTRLDLATQRGALMRCKRLAVLVWVGCRASARCLRGYKQRLGYTGARQHVAVTPNTAIECIVREATQSRAVQCSLRAGVAVSLALSPGAERAQMVLQWRSTGKAPGRAGADGAAVANLTTSGARAAWCPIAWPSAHHGR